MKKSNVIIEGVDAQELLEMFRAIIIETIKKEHPPPPEERMSRLLTIKETAKFFSVSDRSINNWCRHNLLSKIVIGRRVYFEESEVQDLVTKNKTEKKC